MARFKREAQVLASPNHPNISAIYGLEEADGVRALVLAEGETPAERLAGVVASDFSRTRSSPADGFRHTGASYDPFILQLVLVRPEGIEPPAYRFEACRSIQLSYGRDRRVCRV